MQYTQDIDRGWAFIKRELEKLPGQYGKVGFIDEGKVGNKRVRDGASKKYVNIVSDLSMAEVAAVAVFNEFGTTRNGEEHSPERSFFRTTVDEERGKVGQLIDYGYTQLLRGRMSSEQVLSRACVYLQGRVRRKIRDLKEPVNAQSTIDAKGSENPLVDTSQMLNSVTFAIIKGSVIAGSDVGRLMESNGRESAEEA
jgi:hypothetical protein